MSAPTRSYSPAAQDCIHCTVPTANPDGICIFCADYTPPAEGDPAVGELADAYSTAGPNCFNPLQSINCMSTVFIYIIFILYCFYFVYIKMHA